MKIKLIIVSIILLSLSIPAYTQQIQILDFEEFSPLLNKSNDTTYIINFWATWCIPCIKELPDFEAINKTYKDKKFKMLLVSLDFKSQIEKSLIPFIDKHKLSAEVIVLSDPNANEWINKVNKEWSGSIPATIIYNKDFYFFREGSMDYHDLNEIITKNLK